MQISNKHKTKINIWSEQNSSKKARLIKQSNDKRNTMSKNAKKLAKE